MHPEFAGKGDSEAVRPTEGGRRQPCGGILSPVPLGAAA